MSTASNLVPGNFSPQDAIRPLRFIFWGGILWIFDVTFSTTMNGEGFRFDLLDDTLATILITVGVFRLARAAVPGKYASLMTFIQIIAVCSIGSTALGHFIFDYPPPLTAALSVMNLCQLTATVMFCVAMKWFSDAAQLHRSVSSWGVTLLLFLFIYVLPLGFFYIAGLIAMASGTSFNINLGSGGWLLLPVFALPLIHFFISTSRMRHEANERG